MLKRMLGLSLILLSLGASLRAGDVEKVPPGVYQRTVFLGDSITDGDTYPQLVRDALAGAGLPKMIEINAGIGGDTSRGMLGRLQRDVLDHHPTLVTVSAGANDAVHDVTGDSYEANIAAILRKLREDKIVVILLTPNVMGPKRSDKSRQNLDVYEKILRKLAQEHGLRLAEVNRRQKEDAAAGHPQLAPDDVHPNWEGQTMIARAVLDAMGYTDVKVPDDIADAPRPGLIPMWRAKALPAKTGAWTESDVAKFKPDDTWLTLKLPQTQPIPDADTINRWFEGYRKQGASVALRQQAGDKFVAIATIQSDSGRPVQFQTGAALEQIWLNGKLIYQNDGHHGYHIGRESVKAELLKGENVVVIRTGAVFFVSVGEVRSEE